MDKLETERRENSAAEWLRVRLGGFSVSHVMAARKATAKRMGEASVYASTEKTNAHENEVEICRMRNSVFFGKICVKSNIQHSSKFAEAEHKRV
jgi:hypothetical protein